ncbi:HD domain-containing phosphohydrolase [Marinomonas balearica]|uniref:Putative two-component system response regulator n=1 Tax=Marinomonas balearica TaxID=491947 RepID=A0A4R6MBZ7_9GAMM|nr:HD domain-containing phosphohydrolase [Marinomonas balearica]TDO98846.1 putative two-component system response regulator [Marinomonas balearica]
MKNKHKLLIVDDEPNNLKLLRQILKDEYQLMFSTDGLKAIEAAHTHKPDLILLDIMMPGMSGYEVSAALKASPETMHIPIIFVTAMGEQEDEAKGFDMGAVDYILKPFSGAIVQRRVKTHLSLVQVDALEQLVKSSITMLGEAGHYNDSDTGVHIWRMAVYSGALARASGWSEERIRLLELAATMHDTGKIGIPDGILKAPRKLTDEEWVTMKKHSQIGHDILKKGDNPVFAMAAEIALGHHEKWDGSGYPQGLKGGEIPESARIVAIADVFDALTMERPYKEAWTIEQALEVIERDSGSHFDPRFVNLFFEILPEVKQIKTRWGDESGL